MDAQREGGVLIVKPEGRISGLSAKQFQDDLSATIQDDDLSVVINFSDVSFVSSAGLRAILFTGKTLSKRKGKLALCELSESIMEIFTISGFSRILPIHGTQDEAVASLA